MPRNGSLRDERSRRKDAGPSGSAVQKEYPVMDKTNFARARPVPAADEPGLADRVVRAPERTLLAERLSCKRIVISSILVLYGITHPGKCIIRIGRMSLDLLEIVLPLAGLLHTKWMGTTI